MFLAMDVRDKIYGLLGLTSDGSDLVLAPNYVQLATSVYFQLWKVLLSEQRELAYLVKSRASSTYYINPSSSLFQPDWTNLSSGLPHWLLQVLGRLRKTGTIRSKETALLHGPFSTFSSLTLRNSPFPRDRPNRTPKLRTTPFLLKDGLQAQIYVLDLIDSIGTKFYNSNDYWGPGLEPTPDNATEASKSATSWNASTRATWLREQNHQAAKPSHVLKILCQALFSASFLTMGADDSITRIEMTNFRDSILADIITDLSERRTGPHIPHYFLSEWLSENQDLYIHGRKLKSWMDMHLDVEIHRPWYDRLKHKAVSEFVATKSGSEGRKAHIAKSRSRRRVEVKALVEAMNIAASADLKLVVGKHRQIPGLVPMNAEKGDLIALMPNSSLPIVLRPIEDGTARFIGESCIYIFGPPTNGDPSSPSASIFRRLVGSP